LGFEFWVLGFERSGRALAAPDSKPKPKTQNSKLKTV
jgi:hypothetical protein